jgi:DNA-binding SARP family transcriptional activator/predicted ATPase
MNSIIARLLGAPQVLHRGQPLKFRSRKVLALLIYLAVEEGQHQRDKLANLFWPESDQLRGRTTLRNTLTRLRRSLAPAGEFIVTDGSQVGLALDQPFDLDVHTIDATVTDLTPTTPLEALQAALALVRGEFLEGFSLPDAPDFETWATGQREWWHRRVETLFAELTRRQLEMGLHAEAVETATRWTRYAPFNEAAHRYLIETYALAGERTKALQAYEACRVLLAEELGIAPSPEIQELAERIRNVKSSLANPSASRSKGFGLEPQKPITQNLTSNIEQLPLVGRTVEHSRLVAIYRQACQGRTQTICLIGEAGLGKTRLASVFLDWAALDTSPADVLRGRAFEIGGHLPFQPIVDALRGRVDQENAPDDLLSDVWLAELSQLLPELRDRYPDLPQPMAGNADFVQARLFEAVANLGTALARRQPLVLFIDDVQWADAGTRDLLHYLARRWAEANTPALLLLTVRQEGLLTTPVLRDWLTGLGRDVSLTRLELTPLTQADLYQLVHTLDPTEDDPSMAQAQFGEWLLAETDGSPFFVAEMLQMLREQNVLVGEARTEGRFLIDAAATLQRIKAAERVPLPPTVRDLILSRLGHLSEQAKALLLAEAVIGRQCSFERLCQVAQIDEFEGLPALEELLNNRLMVESGDEARPFTFAHDNIRDVVYTEAGVARRRLYHRHAFAALEQDNAPPAELAFHAAAAGLHQPAFSYAVAAGDDALALHAFADAVNFYQQALELTERVAISSEQLCHLCTHYGRALELSGRYQDALHHYVEATATARQNGNKALELATLVAQGTIYSTANELSDFELGESLGQEALALALELDDQAAEARIQWNLLNVYRMTGRNEQALAAGERSLPLAQELNLREEMAYAANDLVYVYQALGDTRRTLTSEETATALWRELGNQPMLTDSLINLANTRAFLGSYDTALTIAAEALQISQSLENQWAHSYSLYTYCLVYWRTMAVDQALLAMKESIRLAQAVGFTGAQVLINTFPAQLLLALGDVARARLLAQTAREVADKRIPLFSPVAIGTLVVVALMAGNQAEAAELLDHLITNNGTINFMNFLMPETAVCRYALAEGNYEDAYSVSR